MSTLVTSLYLCYIPCRDDANLNNLRSSAYEAIMDLIKYSAKVSYQIFLGMSGVGGGGVGGGQP